jgi:hypothetical protein
LTKGNDVEQRQQAHGALDADANSVEAEEFRRLAGDDPIVTLLAKIE